MAITEINTTQISELTADDFLTEPQLDAVNSGITALAVAGFVSSTTKVINSINVTRIPSIYLCQNETDALVASTYDVNSLFIVKGS